jgi:quinolinate synthase
MEFDEYMRLSQEELVARIEKAKKEKNAIILAHNYQILEVQHVADHIGDSLGLSRVASRTNADVVVFCGVDFMAESAKILSPQKTVLLPVLEATCPMANMVSVEELMKAKKENPDAIFLAYVNTTAQVKALVDICCTSANAVNVVKSLGDKEIVFVPDKNLAHHVKKVTGARIKPWNGYCFVHDEFIIDDVERARYLHPEAVFLVHPESPPEVVASADHVLSTSGMADYVANIKTDNEKRNGVIIGTETGLIRQLQEKYPDIGIWPLSEYAVCRNMKRTTLAHVCWSIETGNYEITLPDDIIENARASLEKMIAIQ